MKRAHSPAVPTLDLLEGLPAPQQPVVDSVPPCPLMLLRRSRIASQPISVGDNNNDANKTNTSSSSSSSSRKMGHGTPSTTTTTAAAAVAGLSRPCVLRTMSDSCIPRAPRMSSSEPNPLFLESLPQLSLPPPSVEDGELLAIDPERGNSGGGGQKLSSSLRERMGSLAANFMHFTATSCPGSVGDATGVVEWQLDQEDETRSGSAATGLLLGGREGGTTRAKVVSSSASLTALSLLVSKAFPTAGAAGAAGASIKGEERRHGVLTGVRLDGSSLSTSLPGMQLPPPALAVSTTPRTTTTTARHAHAHAHAHGERKEGEAPFSFSAFTASTAATTASSVSSAGDGLEEDEDVASAASSAASALSSSSSSQASEGEMEEEGEGGEEAVGSPSADAAMGPFVLEELSLEH